MIVKIKNNQYINLDNLKSFKIQYGIKRNVCGYRVSALPYFILEFTEIRSATNEEKILFIINTLKMHFLNIVRTFWKN